MLWYQAKGNESDTVLSSRVRFARNLSGYRFDAHLAEKDAKEIIEKVGVALGDGFTKVNFDDRSPMAAESLVEQHLVSRDFTAMKGPHALYRNDENSVYVMTPEEDHIRLQCILPGLSLEEAYRRACEYDDKLDAALPIAYDEKLGYLTHCPTNLGTGMRASVMLFLPALSAGGFIPSLSHQLAKVGLTMRGIYGEGSESYGSLYQVSNQITLGLTEEDILRKLTDFVQNIIDKERKERNAVKGEALAELTDKICRAEGTLRYATRISSSEFFSLYEKLKLGVAMGIVTSVSDETLNALLINVLPATLTLASPDSPKNGAERDSARAAFIKKALGVATAE